MRASSKTALMVAAYRARASQRENSVCSDPWAAELAGDEGFALAERLDEHAPGRELWIALRTAYLDSHVCHFLGTERGFAQVIILGAGLDTRAARLASEGVRFFEVDHPATQAEKRRRLGELANYPLDAAEFVTCDFETEDFLLSLERAGFVAEEPAVFIWEGVTPYLDEGAVRATARSVAHGCHLRTVLILDYLSKRLVQRIELQEKDQDFLEYFNDLGETMRWGTNDVLPLLYDEGFRYVRTVSFDELALQVTGTYDRAREFRFQHIALASRTAPPLPY